MREEGKDKFTAGHRGKEGETCEVDCVSEGGGDRERVSTQSDSSKYIILIIEVLNQHQHTVNIMIDINAEV